MHQSLVIDFVYAIVALVTAFIIVMPIMIEMARGFRVRSFVSFVAIFYGSVALLAFALNALAH